MTDNTINKEPGTAVEKNCGNCGGCTAPNVPKLHTLFLGVTEDCNYALPLLLCPSITGENDARHGDEGFIFSPCRTGSWES